MSKRSSKRRAEEPQGPPPSVRVWASVLAIAALATAISAYLTYAYYKLREDSGWQSLCDVSAQFSCGAVAASDYSSIAGVPIAWMGAVFYALLTLLAARSLRGVSSALPRSPSVALVAAGALASGLSVVLALVSSLLIRSFCPLCLALYACNAALLVLGLVELRREKTGFKDLVRAERRAFNRGAEVNAKVLLMALALFGGVPLAISMRPPLRGLCEYLADNPGGRTRLVIYTDYQCPFCRKAELTLDRLRSKPGVAITVRNYPLDRECNPKLERTIHPGACLQASAVICAEKSGLGAEFRRLVFEGSAKDSASLQSLARSLGIEAGAFEACLRSPETASRLAADVEAARDDGVHATPTLFVDGRRYKGSLAPEFFECLPQEESRPARPREAAPARSAE